MWILLFVTSPSSLTSWEHTARSYRSNCLVAQTYFPLAPPPTARRSVGRQNCEVALEVMRAEGFQVLASSLGGTLGRSIKFYTATGEVRLRWLSHAGTENDAEKLMTSAPLPFRSLSRTAKEPAPEHLPWPALLTAVGFDPPSGSFSRTSVAIDRLPQTVFHATAAVYSRTYYDRT